MDLQESSTSDDTEDTETEPPLPRKEKKGRSATMCPKVTKLCDGEPRIIVSYNSRGQPIVILKMILPVTKVKFVLKKDERRKRVSAIGASWKKFKSLLTTKYIRPFEDDPERLRYPPKIYEKIIPQNDWEVFVKQRISDEFKLISAKQSARRKQKVYNHRMSKKGYAGLAEELKMKLGPTFDENNRSYLWKEAHKDQKGLYPNDATKEVAEKILKYLDHGDCPWDGGALQQGLVLCSPYQLLAHFLEDIDD
ncbi:hypothetical protein FRX31_009584 [Thalictrum thalictroides]|uniref:Uncharacterized protein n=1 Tax=Thalictrum thalictroides TaxID=46969 RepID=A0A7J6WW87_THATH|nr:hypothetical protein FRX31_009584 [Thalictrum thalictroides]